MVKVGKLEVEVDKPYMRSPSGGLKAARMAIAFMAVITFAVKRSHEAFLTLVIMELVFTFLFYLLYLLQLHKKEKVKSFLWPLADAFDSLVAALFLLIVGLCATIIVTIKETVIGGVFCLVLCILCVTDAALILKKVKFNKPAAGRNIQRQT